MFADTCANIFSSASSDHTPLLRGRASRASLVILCALFPPCRFSDMFLLVEFHIFQPMSTTQQVIIATIKDLRDALIGGTSFFEPNRGTETTSSSLTHCQCDLKRKHRKTAHLPRQINPLAAFSDFNKPDIECLTAKAPLGLVSSHDGTRAPSKTRRKTFSASIQQGPASAGE